MPRRETWNRSPLHLRVPSVLMTVVELRLVAVCGDFGVQLARGYVQGLAVEGLDRPDVVERHARDLEGGGEIEAIGDVGQGVAVVVDVDVVGHVVAEAVEVRPAGRIL